MRLGIRSKLFLAALALIAASGAVGNGLLADELRAISERRSAAELASKTELARVRLAAADAPLSRGAATEAMARELSEAARARVTIADAEGRIVGDSAAMDGELEVAGARSDADRPEIARALAGRAAEAERASDPAVGRVRFLAAPVLRGGELVGVVRLGVPAAEVEADVARLHGALWVSAVIALAAAALLASVASHLVSQGVRDLAEAARRLAGGDLDARARSEGEDELSQLGRSIDDLAAGLRATLRELVQERDLLSGLLDNLGEGVLLLDRDGKVALVNPALREMLLLSADDVGKHPLEVIRHAQLADLLEVAKHGRAQGEIEVLGLKPRRLLVRAEALERDLGGVFVVFYDVTDLRRLETLRRDFVANASHELRTPVTSIRSAAETLQVAGGKDPATLERFLGIIERNAARLQRLLEDLLDLSRIESRELHLVREPVGLRAAAERSASLLTDRAARARVSIEVEVDDDVVALADARALEQILDNLLDNAVKYCPGANVRVAAEAVGDVVALRVTDGGPGIEARHLDRLFERFYRVDAGRSRQLGGTGLGLSIVKHLVEAMEGSIDVESEIGRGTTFTIRLPVPRPAAAPSTPPPSFATPSHPAEVP